MLGRQTLQNGISQCDRWRLQPPVRDGDMQLLEAFLHLTAHGAVSNVRAEFIRQFLLPKIEELLQPVFKIKTGHDRYTSMGGIEDFCDRQIRSDFGSRE